MPDTLTTCRHAAGQAVLAVHELLQADDRHDLLNGEAPERLADALRLTLHAADPDCTSDRGRQLLGALERYLDGWVG